MDTPMSSLPRDPDVDLQPLLGLSLNYSIQTVDNHCHHHSETLETVLGTVVDKRSPN